MLRSTLVPTGIRLASRDLRQPVWPGRPEVESDVCGNFDPAAAGFARRCEAPQGDRGGRMRGVPPDSPGGTGEWTLSQLSVELSRERSVQDD
jgi:hypothetical protein